jgi:integrase/recombinase XerC
LIREVFNMPPSSARSRLDSLPNVQRRVLAHNRDLCRGWLTWLEQHGRARVTVYQYGARLDELLEFLGDTPLDAATLDQLEAWVARPRKGRAHGDLGADSTRAKEVLVLRGLFRWAVDHGKLAHNPAVLMEVPTVKNEDPKAIDVDAWHTFWSSPCLSEVERVVFGLGFFGGFRRLEMCTVGPHHVDAAVGRIEGFQRKGDRNGKRSGVVPIESLARLFSQEHPRLLHSPEDFLGPLYKLSEARRGEQWLIPWGEEVVSLPQAQRGGYRPVPDGMTSPDQINHRLRRALKNCGMDGTAFTPHALRHSFVTYLLRGGVPLEVVSKMANHSSLNITLRYLRMADDPIEKFLRGSDDERPTTSNLKGVRW